MESLSESPDSAPRHSTPICDKRARNLKHLVEADSDHVRRSRVEERILVVGPKQSPSELRPFRPSFVLTGEEVFS